MTSSRGWSPQPIDNIPRTGIFRYNSEENSEKDRKFIQVFLKVEEHEEERYEVRKDEKGWKYRILFQYLDKKVINKNDTTFEGSFVELANGTRRSLRWITEVGDLYDYYLSRFAGTKFREIFREAIHREGDAARILEVLANFDRVIKNNNLEFCARWVNYMEMTTLLGYPSMENRTMSDDPHKWLTEEVHDTVSSDSWAESFKESWSYFSRMSKHPSISLREYTRRRWLWTTNGASAYSKLYMQGKKVKSKFGAAVSLSDSDLVKLVENSATEPIGIFLKGDEKGMKRRLIANVPLGMYITCSHILNFFLANTRTEAPWIGTTDLTLEQHMRIVDKLKGGATYVPLDESAYDYHFTRNMWDGFIKFAEGFETIRESVGYLKRALGSIKWQFRGREGIWQKGMPSGLALTTFLNSWANVLKQQRIGVIDIHASGDDALFIDPQRRNITELSDEYAKFGAVINPAKNWIQKGTAEYLKRVYTSAGVKGYAARIFSSLIWQDRQQDEDPFEKMYELADLWKQLEDRMGLVFEDKFRDISRSVMHRLQGFGKREAERWWHTCGALGGFGGGTRMDGKFIFTSEVRERVSYTGSLIRLPEKVVRGDWSWKIVPWRKTPLPPKTGRPPPIGVPKTMEEWEARINMEDLPVPAKYKSEFFNLIPVPKVDGYGTDVVSKFLMEQGFFRYPNMVGDSERYNRRLLGAEVEARLLFNKWVDTMGIIGFA